VVLGARVRAAAVTAKGRRIGIIAALPGELKPLVNTGWERLPTAKGSGVSMWQTTYGDDEVLAVCAGMGPAAALRAFSAAEYRGSLDVVLSVGWAGALQTHSVPGQVYIPSAVVDAQTGERYQLSDGQRKLILVSTAHVAMEKEKHRLATSYSGAFVDMESATVLRLAGMRGIPACCLKAVSDELGEDLPNFGNFTDEQGQLRMLPFLGFVAFNPRYWGPLGRLGRNSSKGAHALASAIITLLTGPKDLQEINRTGNVDW